MQYRWSDTVISEEFPAKEIIASANVANYVVMEIRMILNMKPLPAKRLTRNLIWLAIPACILLPVCCWAGEIAERGRFSQAWFSSISQELWLMAIWLLGSLLLAKLAGLIWKGVLLPLARMTRTTLDVMVIEQTQQTIQLVVLTALLELGARIGGQYIPSFSGHPAWSVCSGTVYVAFVLSITLFLFEAITALTEWYGRKIAGRTESAVDDQFLALFKKTVRVVFFFIAATIALEHFGVKITGLLATAGVASLALAFAAQETLSNMISGFVLMIDRPFKVGDRVELSNGKTGDVLEVGLRSTRILSTENTVITIPNAEVAKSQIVNLTMPSPRSKVKASLGLVHGSDVRKAKKAMMEVFGATQGVLKEPVPVVLLSELGESALKISYEFWVASYNDQGLVADAVNMAIKDRFEAEGVQLAMPRRTIHVMNG